MGRGSFANRGGGGGGTLTAMDIDRMSFRQVEQAIMDANDIDTLDMIAEAAGNSENFTNQESWQLYSMALTKAQLWQPTAGDMYNATQAQKNVVARIVGKADESAQFRLNADGEVVITYTSPTTGKNMIGYINKKGVIKYQ